MPEVITVGKATYCAYPRPTPLGNLREGTVKIISPTVRTIHVCGGVDAAADAFREALSNTVKLLQHCSGGAGAPTS
jgi:hypothetical protein